MKKLIICAVAGLLSCTAFAQQNHEISVYAGGGLSSMKYSSDFGNRKNEFGGLAGIAYKYYFIKQWGIGTAAELSLYNSKFTFGQLSDKYITTDIDGSNFEFRSTINSYEEKQKAMYLNIPLMLYFQTTGKNKFYAAAGGKIGIPLNSKYKTSGATIRNSGYYAAENYEYTTQEFMGFGTFTHKDMDEALDFKVAYMLSAEAGMKWKLNNNLFLYTGAYFDYGLNDIRKNKTDRRFVEYNRTNPKHFKTNSILYSRTGNNQSLSNKAIPMAAGIKVSLAFGLGSKKKIESVSEPIIPVMDTSKEEAARKAAEQARLKAEQEASEARRLAELQEKDRQRQQEEAERAKAIASIQQPVSEYELNQIHLTPDKKQEINNKIELLKKYVKWTVICEGHTCNLGNSRIKERIGLERAEEAKQYMIENGISENRIIIISKGDSQPLAPNDNEENRKKNRRVEIIVKN